MNNEEKILSMLETLTQGQTKLEQGQTKLEQEITDIKHTLVKIENEHGQKLNALFDGYDMLHKISTEIRSDIAVLKGTHEEHDLHIKWLEHNKCKTVG